ncbi:BQ2448_6649 [Microbotryum intermedium]|uniref:BQ2448_6649 protein n=1 Tax=Microbotryum intermedium TaxID=269621 RepID=A0A238FLU0_9BASI|nr:BQ2448_6649 [Microbotryum intermedium]
MLPVIDLDVFRQAPVSSEALQQAHATADALIRYGALIVKDSRVSDDANEQFLDVMEDYFAQSQEELLKDTRPEFHYQAGATLESTEKPKCHSDASCQAVIASLDPSERPLDLQAEKADPKCRFFWRMGVPPPPESTSFGSMTIPNVIPAAFAATWESSMQKWGTIIRSAVSGVSEMLAVGLGLPQDEFLRASIHGPHLLAPTATDLQRFGQLDSIFAGFHTDLNFLTIHGRSRYPGLHIWARNSGQRIEVKLPPGHLLVQAAKQLEHVTGGLILAGYHEVACTKRTMAMIESRRETAPKRPLIRISSTFFHHLSSDYQMKPMELTSRMKLDPEWIEAKQMSQESLPPVEYEEGQKVGTLVENELRHIALKKD